MRKCPRCHSSMMVDYDAGSDGFTPVWKCLGCGRSVFVDPDRQAEDARIQAGIMRKIREEHQAGPM